MCSLGVGIPSGSEMCSLGVGIPSGSEMCSLGVGIPSLFSPPRERSYLACHWRLKPSYLPQLKKASIKSPLRHTILRCSSSQAADEQFDSNNQPSQEHSSTKNGTFWGKWMASSAEMRAKVAKLGLAAVLAYGLFDGVTYTTFFVLAFLGYEKSTGKNPAANLQALLGIVLLMWTGNNVTRPFRVAGAAALAPAIDKGLKSVKEKLNLPSIVYAFALVVGILASSCLSVAGLLILSRWGK